MQSYIAAGFDPARFWDLTPRLYAAEMEGARGRIRRERALAWESAMLTRMKDPPSFDAFIGAEKKVEPETFLKMRLAAAHKGMAVLTMAQWRESRGKP